MEQQSTETATVQKESGRGKQNAGVSSGIFKKNHNNAAQNHFQSGCGLCAYKTFVPHLSRSLALCLNILLHFDIYVVCHFVVSFLFVCVCVVAWNKSTNPELWLATGSYLCVTVKLTTATSLLYPKSINFLFILSQKYTHTHIATKMNENINNIWMMETNMTMEIERLHSVLYSNIQNINQIGV